LFDDTIPNEMDAPREVRDIMRGNSERTVSLVTEGNDKYRK